MVSIQSLLIPSKVVEVDYPDKDGFKVKVAFLSRDELIKLRKNCTTTKFDRKSRQTIEDINDELFTKNYVSLVVKGWSGLKAKYLQDLLLVDLSSVEDDTDVEYSEDNALLLMKNSVEFDNFISDITSDLANFQKFSSKS